MDTTLAEKIRGLSLPDAYAETTRAVQRIETHFACVFLTDSHAFKLKKPLRVSGMDLSSLELRARNCAEELRLNRRLAADVYLDVVPLVRRADGSLRVGGEGEVIDWLIKMKRLPDALMLDRAMAASSADPAILHALGLRLARFYQEQPRIEFTPQAYLERLDRQIAIDREQLRDRRLQLDASLVDALALDQSKARAALATELGSRAAEGRIVEAHGDLRPEHVCLREPPCVIDSLEFSLDLRTLDPVEELAFFAIECESASAWVAASVIDAYRAASSDPFTPWLFDFYRSRRASVRAKILAWHVLDPDVREQAPWQSLAATYLERARRYARQGACYT